MVLGRSSRRQHEKSVVPRGGQGSRCRRRDRRLARQLVREGFLCGAPVFAGVTNDMTIAREEIFGPVLSCSGTPPSGGDRHRQRSDYGLWARCGPPMSTGPPRSPARSAPVSSPSTALRLDMAVRSAASKAASAGNSAPRFGPFTESSRCSCPPRPQRRRRLGCQPGCRVPPASESTSAHRAKGNTPRLCAGRSRRSFLMRVRGVPKRCAARTWLRAGQTRSPMMFC